MFEIKEPGPAFNDTLTYEYITAANAEIKRLQSQPATFDDIPWDPVTLEALRDAESGIYQLKNQGGDVHTLFHVKGALYFQTPWDTMIGCIGMTRKYTDVKKLPIPLYTRAPKKPKRYEVKMDGSALIIRVYELHDTFSHSVLAEFKQEESALFFCTKLNRLEELEAAQ